jgi:hypothetical protein
MLKNLSCQSNWLFIHNFTVIRFCLSFKRPFSEFPQKIDIVLISFSWNFQGCITVYLSRFISLLFCDSYNRLPHLLCPVNSFF